MTDLNRRIRRLREHKTLTVRQAAQFAGTNPVRWWLWETCLPPPIRRLPSIAAVLQVPVCAFVQPAGHLAVADVYLSPQAVHAIARYGQPEAEQRAEQLTRTLTSTLLEACRRELPNVAEQVQVQQLPQGRVPTILSMP